MPDERAVNILFNAYWGPKGWKSGNGVTREDVEHAKRCRVMFDAVRVTHDDVQAWVEESVKGVSRDEVAAGFVASLTSHRLDLRSALGSYAIASKMPHHAEVADAFGIRCAECDFAPSAGRENLNVLNFERLKWGGVRHADPIYQALDLELFAEAERLRPTSADLAALRTVLDVAAAMPPKARAGKLEAAIAAIIPGDKTERRTFIDILGICGVLQSRRVPGFRSRWVPASERADPPGWGDWKYPAGWWCGADGVDTEAVRWWFPGLEWEPPAEKS